MKLPGYEQAKLLGFTLQYCSGNKRMASYTKTYDQNKIIYLQVTIDEYNETKLKCKVSGIHKMILLESGELSFPHSNINMWIDQILEILPERIS